MLVDTSVWIAHLRSGSQALSAALEAGEVWCHPFVVGELALGNLQNREEILSLLQALPPVETATHKEVLALVQERSLMGRGLGWVDVHLLASALLTGVRLWTLDRRLRVTAEEMGLQPRTRER
jgi:predicted nucleic acid-binding protein